MQTHQPIGNEIIIYPKTIIKPQVIFQFRYMTLRLKTHCYLLICYFFYCLFKINVYICRGNTSHTD